MTLYYNEFVAGCPCSNCTVYIADVEKDGLQSLDQLDQMHNHIDQLVADGEITKGGPRYSELVQLCVKFTQKSGVPVWKSRDRAFSGFDIQETPTNPWMSKTWFSKAATQKVRGLAALPTIAAYTGTTVEHLSKWSFIAAKTIVAQPALALNPGADYHQLSYPLFLRPCPVTPRHGFVDSRMVYRPEEMVHIAEEAVSADPDAELLITPFIESQHSAVLTPTTFSYGKGHDGATSGKSTTVYGPGIEASVLGWIKSASTIEGDDVPYVEMVGENAYMVQSRGGPPVASVQDYVPEDITVTQVLTATADTDLLVWEKAIANAQPGTVVYADGLSLASHFCVHAVVNKVPVLTTKRPHVTDLIEKTDVPVWKSRDWRRLAKFMTEADRVTAHTGVDKGWATLAVSALHCAGTPAPATDAQLRMLAYGAVSVLKCIGSTCIGEARHLSGSSRERTHSSRSIRLSAPPALTVQRSVEDKGYSRNAFYGRGAMISLESWKYVLRAIGPIYRHRDWESGYGGKKWGEINSGAKRIATRMGEFRKSPSAERWAKLVLEWNVTIHKEHNGRAPALNKFYVQRNDMDNMSKFPLAGLAQIGEEKRNILMEGPSAGLVKSGAARLIIPARSHTDKPERTTRTVDVSAAYSHGYLYVYKGDAPVGKALVTCDEQKRQIKEAVGGFSSKVPAKMVVEHTPYSAAASKPVDTLAKALGVDAPRRDSTVGKYVVVSSIKLDITAYYGI